MGCYAKTEDYDIYKMLLHNKLCNLYIIFTGLVNIQALAGSSLTFGSLGHLRKYPAWIQMFPTHIYQLACRHFTMSSQTMSTLHKHTAHMPAHTLFASCTHLAHTLTHSLPTAWSDTCWHYALLKYLHVNPSYLLIDKF